MENWYWISALGWAVANSLWQSAVCWLVYRLVMLAAPQSPANFRHLFSLILLSTAFGWFVLTAVEYYYVLQSGGWNAWLQLSATGNNLLEGISLLYLLMLAFYSFRLGRNLAGLQRLQSTSGLKAPAALRIFTEQTAIQLGIRQQVRLLLSDQVDVPSVVGVLKPLLLLPVSACTQLSTPQLEAVILHELAHIRRYDYLINLLQSFLELVLFFNPFARMLGAEARKERENSCDDWVLNFRYDRNLYAAALLQLEQQRRTPIQLAMTATNGKPLLLQRIQRLFNITPTVQLNRNQRLRLLLSCSGIVLILLLSLPLLRPGYPIRATLAAPVAQVQTVTGNDQQQAFHTSIPGVITLAEAPVIPARKKEPARSVPDQAVPADAVEEPTLAYINDELLRTPGTESLQIIPAAVMSEGTMPRMLKVEEEQSGQNRKITYIAELRNDEGTPTLQPLILLRSPGSEIRHPADTNRTTATDSLHTAPLRKKRITS